MDRETTQNKRDSLSCSWVWPCEEDSGQRGAKGRGVHDFWEGSLRGRSWPFPFSPSRCLEWNDDSWNQRRALESWCELEDRGQERWSNEKDSRSMSCWYSGIPVQPHFTHEHFSIKKKYVSTFSTFAILVFGKLSPESTEYFRPREQKSFE